MLNASGGRSRGRKRLNSSFEYLARLRQHELAPVIAMLPPHCSILEIGAGMGWQAQALAERGFTVTAIDIPGGFAAQQRVYPVIEYDGFKIPFPNHQFDVVFSSNVLEHIAHLDSFQNEIKRVLRDNGQAIHILPSAGWRFWTTLAHYPYLIKRVWAGLTPTSTAAWAGVKTVSRPNRRWLQRLLPPRHGERGNFLSEIYWFSKRYWQQHFRQTGWEIEAYVPNRLFYTGYEILNIRMNLKIRRRLSYVLGSACHIFCLHKLR